DARRYEIGARRAPEYCAGLTDVVRTPPRGLRGPLSWQSVHVRDPLQPARWVAPEKKRSCGRKLAESSRFSARSGRAVGGEHRAVTPGEQALQPVEEHGLIRVDDPTSARNLDEFRLVDLPGRTPRLLVGGGRARERVDPLLRARVVDEADRGQGRRHDPGLLGGLAARRSLHLFSRIWLAFRDP